MKRSVIVALIEEILGLSWLEADSLADGFIRSDFPLNGVKTYGQAIALLQDVQALRLKVRARGAQALAN